MSDAKAYAMGDGVQVVVPSDAGVMTAYVLEEQHDWLESEIGFVRRFVQSGDVVVDIGANFGVYALAAAKCTGSQGRVLCFEPAASTADALQQSVARNGFGHVVVERKGLSDKNGEARLSIAASPELNHLLREGDEGQSERIELISLDEAVDAYQLERVDFLKLDAEGEESNILKGGEAFFARFDPLVMYEVKEGEGWHLELVKAFAELGYDSYRLVPGLNVLVPFDPAMQPDSYQLNLFACKPQTAEELAARNLLVTASRLQGVQQRDAEALNF